MVKFTSKPKWSEMWLSVQSDNLKGSEIQMIEEQKTKEKICAFYASDYHFEMITLPYICENIKQNKKIIVLTENNLEETMKKVISRMNLKKDKITDILKIDWKTNNLEKIEKIKKYAKAGKETIIFIKGKQNYIKNMEDNIKEWTSKNETLKLIDCYDIDEVSEKMNKIMEDYGSVLTTIGEKEINKI